MTDKETKRQKAVPTTVTMLDMILENRKLKSEIFDLKERVKALEERLSEVGNRNPRVGGGCS